MTNRKTTRRALVLSLLSLLLCCSMLVGTTFAWFTDSVQSGNNQIVAGNLDVELYHSDKAVTDEKVTKSTLLFDDIKLWEPGVVAWENLKVANEGTLALKYELSVNFDNATKTPEGKTLADVLKVAFVAGGVDGSKTREEMVAGITGWGEMKSFVQPGKLEAGVTAPTTDTYGIVIWWEPGANDNDFNMNNGNRALELSIDLGINLFATQVEAELDSFGNDYDEDAIYADAYVSDSVELAKAINDGAEIIYLRAGNYSMPDGSGIETYAVDSTAVDLRGKTLKLVGPKAAVLDVAHIDMRDQFVTGAKLTFEGLTLKFGGTEYMGFANPVEATYRDCAIIGLQYLSGGTVNYEGCEFVPGVNSSGKTTYCVATYTAKVVNITDCTFDTAGKAVLVYAESHFDSQTVNVKDCTFKASESATTSAGDVCAAVEIDASLIQDTYTVSFDGENSVGPKFAGLYRIKNQKDPANVAVNVSGKSYTSVSASTQEELNTVVNAGNSVKLELAEGSYRMPDGSEGSLRSKSITIVGTKDTVIDASNVDARDQFVTGADLTFEGVTLNFGTANYMGFANTKNLTYKNCTINGLQFLFGENVTFENCTFNSNGAEHSVWTYGVKNVSFTGCDFTYGDRGINCYSDNDVAGGKQTVSFTDCTFTTENTASEGAVEINSCFFSVGIEVNLTGCTAPAYGELAYVSPWDSTNGAKTTINIQ